MKKSSIIIITIITLTTIGLLIPFSVIFLIITNFQNKINYQPLSFISRIDLPKKIIIKKQPLPNPLTTPKMVKGIYLTGYTLSNKKSLNKLIKLATETEINSFVINIKDSSGQLMFTPISPKIKKIPVSLMALSNKEHKKILKELQKKEIYTIARVTTFQDPTAVKIFPDLALKNKQNKIWQNWQGITWLDMTNKKAWQIPIEEAKEAINLGYDEIQFDYIRFPSDGNIGQIKYFNFPNDKKKYKILQKFYKYAQENLKKFKVPLSVDLFGLTYEIKKNKDYDLNIGQRVIDVVPYFDYISPMIYPSHYAVGYLGFQNPAKHPYTVISYAMLAGKKILKKASSTNAQSRPWLQDFDIGANYTADLIRAQIKAVEESGASGWLLWNPLNHYTIGGLKKD